MISLDSPVETVLGTPRDKSGAKRTERITEGLGLRTVRVGPAGPGTASVVPSAPDLATAVDRLLEESRGERSA